MGFIQTAFADPFSTAAQAVVLALGAGHLVLAFLAWRAKGPIGRGGWLHPARRHGERVLRYGAHHP